MLVLSRGRNDKIVFPNLGITVEILNIASNKVRVGVDAPPSVTVLRHELAGEAGAAAQAESLSPTRTSLSHEIRNRLHAANLALHLSQKLLQANRQADAERTLQKALDEFAALEARLTSRDQPAPADTPARTRGHALDRGR